MPPPASASAVAGDSPNPGQPDFVAPTAAHAPGVGAAVAAGESIGRRNFPRKVDGMDVVLSYDQIRSEFNQMESRSVNVNASKALRFFQAVSEWPKGVPRRWELDITELGEENTFAHIMEESVYPPSVVAE